MNCKLRPAEETISLFLRDQSVSTKVLGISRQVMKSRTGRFPQRSDDDWVSGSAGRPAFAFEKVDIAVILYNNLRNSCSRLRFVPVAVASRPAVVTWPNRPCAQER